MTTSNSSSRDISLQLSSSPVLKVADITDALEDSYLDILSDDDDAKQSEESPLKKRTNKIWNVAPLFDVVLRGCRAQPRMDHISIDEMSIPFSGQCGIRQYCPGKPNPVGIRYLCNSLRYGDLSRVYDIKKIM
ncbi:unnamed protein product [Parnassius apollo]|uniref:(apollo) hypothetical protein n=1 Tax=Parnassius apollo TaxID=110799 RepID=A0A8S3WS13_PARAO|nr:unnamed protein product [Parnassius apollo]